MVVKKIEWKTGHDMKHPSPFKTIRDMRSFIWNYTYTQTPEEKGIETAEKTVVNATVGLQNFASPPPKNIFASQPCRAMPVGGTELCLLRNAGIDGLQQQLCAT
jgi:hypothetical protein